MSTLWRPFSSPECETPISFASGDGANLTTNDGRTYLDAISGLWNTSLGLGDVMVLDAMRAQMDSLVYSSLFHASHAPAERLADQVLLETGFDMKHVYLSTSGSAAVEVAIRVARLHHLARNQPSKRRILSFDLSYHGCSAIALSASGILAKESRRTGELLPEFQHVCSPINAETSLKEIEDILVSEADQVAAFIVEPILGSGGIIVPPASYGEALTLLCRKHDVLLLCDEVATGGGRCGRFLASSLVGLTPDVVTLSKGINGGYYPLGITLFTDNVVRPIAKSGFAFQYGSTQDGNPVGCVSALAAIAAIKERGLMQRAEQLGEYIKGALSASMTNSVIKAVRGIGLMIGVELAHQDVHRSPFSDAEISKVQRQCMEAGVLVYAFNSGFSLFPPMTLTDEQAHDLVDILYEVLQHLY